jgi:anti-sigma factor RsiW
MNRVDEHIERLIVRHLDGELTPSEQDELNEILLRSGEARRLLSDYQENDRLASEVIGAVAAGRWPRDAGTTGSGRWQRLKIGLPIAVGLAAAAAIVLMIVSPPQGTTDLGPPPVANGRQAVPEKIDAAPSEDLTYTASDLPQKGVRHTRRDYIGIYDESRKSMLLFEVDRTRTVRIPISGDL